MGQRFTRAEFYELVWSRPMTHLAKEFGLSDVALHKVCRKHDIPNPPLGWWAKKAAGKTVKRIPLPELESGVSDTIVITGGELRNEPEDIARRESWPAFGPPISIRRRSAPRTRSSRDRPRSCAR